MKILAIRLKNLASIEGTFDIDFTAEPLLSAGIFAISGPTGAGKSTLLDALCLALYDKTPRFATTGENLYLTDVGENVINQSDVKNILRRGAGEGLAEVVFQGVDGYRYQSRWMVRRARNKPDGSLQPQTIQVINLDTEEELQGTKTELLNRLAALVGLTYEQFTRTVLLAQNDFATFLKSRESAKAELLEKLTGTEIYSQISKAVYTYTKAANEAFNQLKGNLELIKILPEDEWELLLQNKIAFQSKKNEVTRLLDSLLEKQKLTQSLKAQQEKLQQKQQEETLLKETQEKLKAALLEQTEEMNIFRKKCEELQPALRKARELDIRIQGAQTNFSQAESAGKSIRSFYSFIASQPEEEQKNNEERSRKLNNFGIQALGEEQNALSREQDKLRKARQQTVDWLKLQQNAEQLSKEQQEKKVFCEQIEKELTVVTQQLSVRQEEVKRLQSIYDSLRIAVGKDVQQLRQALIHGEACPVCGSMEHPYTQQVEAVESHYRLVEKEYKTVSEGLQETNNRFISLQRDVKHLKDVQEQLQKQRIALQEEIDRKRPAREEEQQISWFDEQLETLRKQQEALSARLKEYQQLYEEWVWYDYKIKETILNTLCTERQTLLKGKSVDQAEASIQQKEKKLTDSLELICRGAEKAQAGLSGVQGEIKQLVAAVDALKKEQEQIEAPEDLAESISQVQKSKSEIESQLSVVEAQIIRQEESKARLKSIEKELKEKQAIAEKWEKLNKLIGSADGNKFKVIAQSYTLNLLLMHANTHLSYLSKRYKLQQVPDTLALQVIDCDMCDEVRTVYSLSGGESFLISLALALGLSSLSGNNLKVESLFIDEGFGSLDADSLRTAMDALEQLQLQGRKIGVISHVQEMSKRIPVQIQVHKTANGKSRIEIV